MQSIEYYSIKERKPEAILARGLSVSEIVILITFI